MASIDKMMNYAKSRWHEPKYKLGGGRIGAEASYRSPYEDCSGFVYKCAKVGGFIPESMWNGSTEDLFRLARQGKYLKEISYKDVRRGDIFVKGKEGASGGAYGHTGIFTRKGEIIHCNAGSNWTVTTNNENEGYWYYLDDRYYPVRFFRWIGSDDEKETPKKKAEPKKTTPSPSVIAGARKVKNEKWHGLTTAYCNVRSGPSTASPVVAQYRPGQVIYYDEVWEGNGYRWLSYIGGSNQRRWVAYRRTSGNTKAWIKF
ncbi:peptidoglycan amidohydrolase family protein [Anaerococcus sp. Marseille-P3915]|uniref:peptidoglycan amidohydrolase family protein n=1 Tax=Anaerococcus sp. Marseille-P3915 TaxID=2057799 RepID=UPI000D0B2CAB|nr:peptidoglycan amidohydrolase family protein [Anaerococcus sp. Marseille-P3915]